MHEDFEIGGEILGQPIKENVKKRPQTEEEIEELIINAKEVTGNIFMDA